MGAGLLNYLPHLSRGICDRVSHAEHPYAPHHGTQALNGSLYGPVNP